MFEHVFGLSPPHHNAMEPVHVSMRLPYEYTAGYQVPYGTQSQSCQCQPGTTQPKILQSILNSQLSSSATSGEQRHRVHHSVNGRSSTCSSPRSSCSSPYSSHCPSPAGSMHSSSHHCPSPSGSLLSGASSAQCPSPASRFQGAPVSSCPSPRSSYCPSPASSYHSGSTSPHSQCSSPNGSVEGRGFCPSPMTTQPCVYESKLFSLLSLPRTEARQHSMSSNRTSHSTPSLKRSLPDPEPAEQPMDLSCKKQKVTTHRPEANSSNSILEAILCGAPKRQSQPQARPTHVTESKQSVMSDNPNQRVTLAKKNLLPVSARVSDWLVKIVQFALSLPEFTSLPHNEQVTLLLNSWARLLLLYMAENNFEFAIAPVFSPKDSNEDNTKKLGTLDPEVPTQRSVEKVEAFVRKCQCLALDKEEYRYMRMATLFNPSCPLLDNPSYVDNVNMCVRQSLQDFINRTLPADNKRYSQLLLCLPTLFSINPHMVESLFCKHISGGTDANVLLKEMLKQGL